MLWNITKLDILQVKIIHTYIHTYMIDTHTDTIYIYIYMYIYIPDVR